MSIRQGTRVISGNAGYRPPLLSHQWDDHIRNDIRWLRADTFSWQNGGVYQLAYNHLSAEYTPTETLATIIVSSQTYERNSAADVDNGGTPYYAWKNSNDSVVYTASATPAANDDTYILSSGVITPQYIQLTSYTPGAVVLSTETIGGITISYYRAADGHKICPADQEQNVQTLYNEVGVAWYYILDTANQRFKLPRTKFSVTGIRDEVGNYVAPGLPNITGYLGLADRNSNAGSRSSGAFAWESYGSNGYAPSTSVDGKNAKFDASLSNSIYGNGTTVQPPATQMYLYFYMGEFTQTALENTAGITSEALNAKADITAVPDLVVPDFSQKTSITAGTIYYADKTYLAIYSAGAGNERRLQISKNADMTDPITIGEIWITASGSIFFVSATIIPKGYYYKADSGLSVSVVPIG